MSKEKTPESICEEQGHDWIIYAFYTGYGSNDIEKAGICDRCEFDTHGEFGDLP